MAGKLTEAEQRVKRLQDEEQKERDDGLKTLVGTRIGRRFLWHLLSDCHVFATPYAGNALQTAFNCGEQNIGQKVLDHLTEIAPDAFLVMIKENQDAIRSRTDADNAANASRTGGVYYPDRGDDGRGAYPDPEPDSD